ncbi:MAG: SIMPL domain-containing protein [Chloroflexi bacterium]|nr:SIMPL domain-containing protein [Chloroflexota bacterium]
MKMNKKWLMVVGPLLALALAAGACVNAPAAAPAPGPANGPVAASQFIVPPVSSQQTGLWVNGEGKATFVPDIAVLTLGIESQDQTVAAAQNKARDAMNRILAALKAKNVADKDIRTTSFNIQAVRQWLEPLPVPSVPRGKPESTPGGFAEPGFKPAPKEVIVGYRVSNTVSVKIRKIDEAGQIIDAVSEAGGDLTRVNGIGFTMDDFTPLRTQAREKAVKDAVAKGKQMAEAAGIGLGKTIYINESGGFVPQTVQFRSFGVAAAAPSAAPTPISAGEQELNVSVQMVFEIK